jgi:hypothetical protein
VEVVLQHLRASSCVDILSGESLRIVDGKVPLTIPAGLFRILDLTHQ